MQILRKMFHVSTSTLACLTHFKTIFYNNIAFRPATLLRRDSNTSVFLWILRNFQESLLKCIMVKRVKENQIILTTFTTVLLRDIGSSTNIPLIVHLSGLDFASADCTFVYSPFSYSSLHPAQKKQTPENRTETFS